MAPRSVTAKQEIHQTFTQYGVLSKNSHHYSKAMHQDEFPRESSDSRVDGLTASILNHMIRDPCHVNTLGTTTNTIFDTLRRRSQNTQVLSPSSPVSTATSPGSASSVWDSPKTPSRGPNDKNSVAAWTPLTPPTTRSMTAKHKIVHATPHSPVITSKMFDEIDARTRHLNDRGVKDDFEGQEQDDFVPKKLIRGLTAELLAIVTTNAEAAPGRYNLDPSFNFARNTTTRMSFAPPKARKSMAQIQKEEIGADQIKMQSPDRKLKNNAVPQSISLCANTRILLEHIIPWGVHARLQDQPSRCIASYVYDPSKRCRSPGKGSLARADEAFQMLSQCSDNQGYTDILTHVEKLVQVAQCGSHKNSALPRLEKLRALVSDLALMSSEERLTVSGWVEAISDLTRPPQQEKQEHIKQEHVKHIVTRSVTIHTTHTPPPESIPRSTVRTSYALNFTFYQPKWQAALSVQKALLKAITKPLKATDEKPGFIYIFWDFSHFGMAKIGRTDDLARRLNDWNTQCKREHSYHGALPNIPHVSRIEHLMHIELKDHRMQRRCEGCPRLHQEWFNVSETHAVKVFRKWQLWIEQMPYALDPESGLWTIRKDMLASLEEVCEPVPYPVPETRQQAPRRKSGGGVGSGQAKNRAARRSS